MRRPVFAFAVALAAYLLGLVLMQPVATGDEPHYAIEAISIARDGDVDLADDYADPYLVRELLGDPSIGPHAFRYPGAGDELRSTHSPGLPLLLAPVAAFTTSVDAMRIVVAVVAALAAALLLVLLDRVGLGSPRLRWVAWAAVVLSAPMVVFAVALFPEIPAAALVLAALVALTGRSRGPGALAVASTAAALLPWFNVRFLALTLAFAAALLVLAWRDEPRRRAALAAAIAPLVISGLVFAAAFQHWYGSPWPTAQYALSEGTRTLSGAYRFGVGNLLSPTFGWLPIAPVHLLAFVAIGLAVRRLGWPALAAIGGAALYLLVIAASGSGFPGFSFAGRQLVVVIPLAAVGILVLLALRPGWRLPFAALGAVSLVLTGSAIADHGQQAPVEAGTVRSAYDALWPSFVVDEPAATWAATASEVRGGLGRPVPDGPLPPAEDVALRAAPGERGVLLQGETTELPAGPYLFGLRMRADEPVPDVVAELELRGPDGDLLHAEPITGAQVPPELGYRNVLGSFHVGEPGRMTITVRTTGAAGLRVGGPSMAYAPGSSLVNTSGFPGLPKALAWIALLVAGAVLVARTAPRVRSS